MPTGALAAPSLPQRSAVAQRVADPVAEFAGGALILAQSAGPRAVTSASFVAWRTRVAADVAKRLDLDAATLEAAWARADADHQVALMAALSQLGAPYRRFTSDPVRGFDCSGLTTYAWAHAGYQLPRSSTTQMRAGKPRTIDTAQAGDLLRYPGHVMMWLGVGSAIVHSPQPGGVVEVTMLSERALKRSKFFDPT